MMTDSHNDELSEIENTRLAQQDAFSRVWAIAHAVDAACAIIDESRCDDYFLAEKTYKMIEFIESRIDEIKEDLK